MMAPQVLTGYFDDSGSEGDTPLVSFSGFVASVDQWLLFERDWKHVLSMPQFDLEYFHMKELRQYKGRFARFKDNLPLQTELFDRLQRIIKARVANTFAATVVQEDYWKINREYTLLESFGPPLVLAGQTAIGKLWGWRKRHHPSAELRIVVDQGIKHWGLLDDAVFRETGFRLIPECARRSLPLQACDLIAWEKNRALTHTINGVARSWDDLRGSFKALLERFPSSRVQWFYLDEAAMRKAFDASQKVIAKRDRPASA